MYLSDLSDYPGEVVWHLSSAETTPASGHGNVLRVAVAAERTRQGIERVTWHRRTSFVWGGVGVALIVVDARQDFFDARSASSSNFK
jgi:hypothetical protein